MASRINVVNRIVAAIAVAVEALGVVGGLDYGVGGDESADFGVVVSGAVEVEAGGVKLFAGELVFDQVGAFVTGRGAVGGVLAVLDLSAGGVGDDVG